MAEQKKPETTEIAIIDERNIRDKIYEVRGVKVMLDFELAEIYGYETKNFNRQVKNYAERFEGDQFMFQLTNEEVNDLSRCKNSGDDRKTYENFNGIDVDGKEVKPEEYTKSPGSVIIKLKPAYLETLKVGEHTLRTNFKDGKSVDTMFTIIPTEKVASLPQTGDNSKLFLWIGLVMMGILGAFALRKKRV
ncbi:MAG: ORF6N domain-containing protein [Clostridia bacterium]|nr:ORF6N domain-containing protein [Clostridia bacterium]